MLDKKLEADKMWRQAVDILIHHNIDCELSRFGDQYYITYPRPAADDDITIELNIHADGSTFRVRLYKWDLDLNECEKIKDVIVKCEGRPAVVASHELRGGEQCEYCVV